MYCKINFVTYKNCIVFFIYNSVESPAVLPPVLVPRHSEFAPPPNGLLTYSPVPEPPMPHNVAYSQNGFSHRLVDCIDIVHR